MLAAIVIAYALIIGAGDSVAGGGRMLILGYLLWDALQGTPMHLAGARSRAVAFAPDNQSVFLGETVATPDKQQVGQLVFFYETPALE